MDQVRAFAFTTDSWTSRANEGFVSLTVHYINNSYELKNYTLKIQALPESHTSENLNSLLKSNLSEWNIDSGKHKLYFVTDNASNIIKAVRLSDTWERIPCFAHTLQVHK